MNSTRAELVEMIETNKPITNYIRYKGLTKKQILKNLDKKFVIEGDKFYFAKARHPSGNGITSSRPRRRNTPTANMNPQHPPTVYINNARRYSDSDLQRIHRSIMSRRDIINLSDNLLDVLLEYTFEINDFHLHNALVAELNLRHNANH